MDSFRIIIENPGDRAYGSSKKARLVTACNYCRAKKMRCSNESHPCETCKAANVPCVYRSTAKPASQSTSTEPAGQQPPSGVSQLMPKPRRTFESSTTQQVNRKRPLDPPPERPSPPKPISPFRLTASLAAAARRLSNDVQVSNLRRVTIPFFRYFGPTANTPGYRRVQVKTITQDGSSTTSGSTPTSSASPTASIPADAPVDASRPSSNALALHIVGEVSGRAAPLSTHLFGESDTHPESSPLLAEGGEVLEADQRVLFDPERPRYPHHQYLPHLVRLFFEHMASHFPFLDEETTLRDAEEGQLPAMLANAICGCSARFSDRESLVRDPRISQGEPFTDMAKLLIVNLLSWPSLEVVQALILISYAEFGSGRDSGLWMWSRMSVSMAMDIGLHRESTIRMSGTSEEQERVRQVWWSAFMIDRINSWGTGRPVVINDAAFDVQLPATELPSTPAYSHQLLNAPQISVDDRSFIFAFNCRLIMLRGQISELINNESFQKPDNFSFLQARLAALQDEMTRFYKSLPPSLHFNVQNFRAAAHANSSPSFLLLHLMFHSVITLLHRPGLLQTFTPTLLLPFENSIELSRSSASTIVHMLGLADAFDPKSFLANPFADLPILTAARAFLSERDTLADTPTRAYNRSVMEASLSTCRDILQKTSKVWGGVGNVSRLLAQQERGVLDLDPGEGDIGDTHVDHVRDVELITQWARKAVSSRRPSLARHPNSSTPASTSAAASNIPMTTSPGSATFLQGLTNSPDAVAFTGLLDTALNDRVLLQSIEADLASAGVFGASSELTLDDILSVPTTGSAFSALLGNWGNAATNAEPQAGPASSNAGGSNVRLSF